VTARARVAVVIATTVLASAAEVRRPTGVPRTVRATPRAPRPTPLAPIATPVVTDADLRVLRERALLFPVPDVTPGTVRDTFADSRDGVRHEALDIPAPRGAPVIAVDDGTVAKRFTSVPGGLTVYLFDDAHRFAYYYAHLDGYAEGLVEGRRVRRGDLLGFVGSTGNAPPDVPHLHFAIFKLEPEARWWVGTAIDPYPLLVRSVR
jgi:murein DD-endopeptidase MepM/ murein hydrolase activator NlpD